MKRALIATLYNEAENVRRWWACIIQQDVQPDEIAVVDGGSNDGTWEVLRELARESSVPVRLKQQRCNIAEGRNLAIGMTDAEVIAANDAGSFPDKSWFGEITRPLMTDLALEVVGGRSLNLVENDFHKLVAELEGQPVEPQRSENVYPSSRNIAFRRDAWLRVGGYPEWLTLTGEDALFNHNLHKIGCRFVYNRNAVVVWMVRKDADAYLRMLRTYGFGAAEARLFTTHFVWCTRNVIFPPCMFFSKHGKNHLLFRYRSNLSSLQGWVWGRIRGRRAPVGWKRVDGVLLSPESQRFLSRKSA